MSVFNRAGKMVRLGSQAFEPLGLWPVISEAGRGASGSAQPAVVPTNVSGYYSKRAADAGGSAGGTLRGTSTAEQRLVAKS